jgi:hypothetical protein
MKILTALTLVFITAEAPTLTASSVQLFVAVAIVCAAFIHQTKDAQR